MMLLALFIIQNVEIYELNRINVRFMRLKRVRFLFALVDQWVVVKKNERRRKGERVNELAMVFNHLTHYTTFYSSNYN